MTNGGLQLIKINSLPLGGVSVIASGDFLQSPSVMGRAAFQLPKIIGYNFLGGNLWVQCFEIYCLTEILRQISDPLFAQILKRIKNM